MRGDLRTHSGLLDSLSNSPSRSSRDGCPRATRVPSSSFFQAHGMWTKHANWGSMRGEGLCALRTRTQLLPFHEPARSFSCDARDRRMPLRVRFLSAMRVARRRPGLWRHCEPARVARFLHRSAAGPSSRTLKRKTACDADRSASHAVLGLTWTRLDSLSLSRAIPLDSLGTHLDSGLTRTTHLRGIASRQVSKSNVRAKSWLFFSRTQTGRELRSTVMRVLRAACSRSGSGHIAALRLR